MFHPEVIITLLITGLSWRISSSGEKTNKGSQGYDSEAQAQRPEFEFPANT